MVPTLFLKWQHMLTHTRLCFNTAQPPCSRQTVQTGMCTLSQLKTQSLTHSRKAAVQTNDQTSLIWVQIYDQSPASYGISTWWGYYEIIPQGASLLYEKTETFESILDYFNHETFTVCYRHSAQDAPSNIAIVKLSGLRVAKKGITKVKVLLRVEKDLVGFFAVEDIFTKRKKSIMFDAAQHAGCRKTETFS